MIAGVFLLIATFLINYYYQDRFDVGFNLAYATGIAMLGCFVLSFVLFTKDKLNA